MNSHDSDYDNIADALAGGVDLDDIPECRQSMDDDMDDEVRPRMQTFFPIDPNAPPIEVVYI